MKGETGRKSEGVGPVLDLAYVSGGNPNTPYSPFGKVAIPKLTSLQLCLQRYNLYSSVCKCTVSTALSAKLQFLQFCLQRYNLCSPVCKGTIMPKYLYSLVCKVIMPKHLSVQLGLQRYNNA